MLALLASALLASAASLALPAPAPRRPMRVLVVDNYDSYTHNLVQLFRTALEREGHGGSVDVVANDAATAPTIAEYDAVVLGPGPGHPANRRDFGLCADILRTAAATPVLGVCLGMQGLAHVHGGAVTRLGRPAHGRRSRVYHDGTGIFEGLPSGFLATRYHSLHVTGGVGAAPLAASAWAGDDRCLMGLRHATRPHHGVQFHPESVATEHAERMAANFLRLAAAAAAAAPARPPPPAPAPAAPPPAGPPRENRVWARRLPLPRGGSAALDPTTLFETLYGGRRARWLLDGAAEKSDRTRFTLMGSDDGGGHALHYDAASRSLVASDATAAAPVAANTTLFSHLRDRLQADGGATRAQLVGSGEAVALPFDFALGWVGYLGYELGDDAFAELDAIEGGRGGGERVGLGGASRDACVPDAALVFSTRAVVVDHREGEAWLIARDDGAAWFERTAAAVEAWAAEGEEAPPPPPVAPALEFAQVRGRARYLDDVGGAQRDIVAGESYELCLTDKWRAARDSGAASHEPLSLYRRLRRRNPAPYAAYLEFDAGAALRGGHGASGAGRPAVAVLCSSPERFLRVDAAGRIEAKPIKGTRARGEDDAAAAAALESDAKELAENLMIADLLRNDIGRVALPGSVDVPSFASLETFATVHQLVTTVVGRLPPGTPTLDALVSAYPPGSMTGAPKRRSCEILTGLEDGAARGPYSGAIGFVSLSGAIDLNVAIRTAVVTPGAVAVGAGGAVTALSDPAAEWAEARLKAAAVIEGVGGAILGGRGEACFS